MQRLGISKSVLVRMTGIPWIDPLVAMAVAIVLLVTGAKLVRTAAGGLLDEQDPELVERVVALMNRELGQGVIRVHHLRAIRAGRVPHISAHLVVPEHFRVDVAHEIAERVAASVGRQAMAVLRPQQRRLTCQPALSSCFWPLQPS